MLLILAAVAINLTIGDNGIFIKAKNVTEKWGEATINEQEEMNKTANFIDNYEKDDSDEPGKIEGVKIPDGFV